MHESLRKVGFVKFVVKGILLGYNATKKSRTGDGNDSGKNNCSLACATAKKKSNVVSMWVALVKIKCSKSRKELKTYAMLWLLQSRDSELPKKSRTKGTITTIKIKTLNVEESHKTEAISVAKVTSSTRKNVWIDLPLSYTRKIYRWEMRI